MGFDIVEREQHDIEMAIVSALTDKARQCVRHGTEGSYHQMPYVALQCRSLKRLCGLVKAEKWFHRITADFPRELSFMPTDQQIDVALGGCCRGEGPCNEGKETCLLCGQMPTLEIHLESEGFVVEIRGTDIGSWGLTARKQCGGPVIAGLSPPAYRRRHGSLDTLLEEAICELQGQALGGEDAADRDILVAILQVAQNLPPLPYHTTYRHGEVARRRLWRAEVDTRSCSQAVETT